MESSEVLSVSGVRCGGGDGEMVAAWWVRYDAIVLYLPIGLFDTRNTTLVRRSVDGAREARERPRHHNS